MVKCRFCGALVSDNKAWCPQCNQPLEVEETRRQQREIDNFAGTLNELVQPVEADQATTDAQVAAASPAQPANTHPTQPSKEKTQVSQDSSAKPSRLSFYLVAGAIAGIILLFILLAVLFASYFLR